MTIHYTASRSQFSPVTFLCEFRGELGNSADVERALGLGDKMSKRDGATGPAHLHDARDCGRGPGRSGCSYVQGAAPFYRDR